jgi:hypothetical protein
VGGERKPDQEKIATHWSLHTWADRKDTAVSADDLCGHLDVARTHQGDDVARLDLLNSFEQARLQLIFRACRSERVQVL